MADSCEVLLPRRHRSMQHGSRIFDRCDALLPQTHHSSRADTAHRYDHIHISVIETVPARPSRLLGNLKETRRFVSHSCLQALPTNSDRRPFRDAEGVLGASTSRIRQMVCTAEFGAGRASR